MTDKTFTFQYHVLDTIDELPEEDRLLLDEAYLSAEQSYSPYSGYHVGAALRLKDGKVIHGSNQENVAYPDGLCAERVAAFYASANFPDTSFDTIAIIAFSDDFEVDTPVAPCGSCRQALSEYEYKFDEPIRVIMKGKSGNIIVVDSVRSLLPFTFNESKLKKK
ncbi:MAG: cytidine deaminase [Bacteroidales bacterium]|nr:cytidine deaminase [Bacteroidales bacterium]